MPRFDHRNEDFCPVPKTARGVVDVICHLSVCKMYGGNVVLVFVPLLVLYHATVVIAGAENVSGDKKQTPKM